MEQLLKLMAFLVDLEAAVRIYLLPLALVVVALQDKVTQVEMDITEDHFKVVVAAAALVLWVLTELTVWAAMAALEQPLLYRAQVLHTLAAAAAQQIILQTAAVVLVVLAVVVMVDLTIT
jgi:hypothetical protein